MGEGEKDIQFNFIIIIFYHYNIENLCVCVFEDCS